MSLSDEELSQGFLKTHAKGDATSPQNKASSPSNRMRSSSRGGPSDYFSLKELLDEKSFRD